MILTAQTLAAVNKNVRTTFWDAYHGAGDMLVDRFAMRANSNAAENIYAWLGAIPGLKELFGEFAVQNLLEHAYSIPNKEFGVIIAVKRPDIERDNLGTYTPRFQALGIAAREHEDELLFQRLIAGFASKCYTGKNFFDNNHEPKKGGVKFSNLGTKKLSSDNFATARANLMGRLNYEGRPMGLGRKLALVVSPKWDKTGRDIVIADNLANGGSNTMKGTAELITSPRLAGASEDNWFLMDLGHPVKPFINQIEVPTEFTNQDKLDDDAVFEKSEFRYKAYRRGNAGFGMPELAYGSTGADNA